MDLIIDAEFRDLIDPSTPEELAGLEESIRKYECLSPVIAWKGQNILLDGHQRVRICERLGKGYKIAYVDLPDRIAAMDWIDANQLSRRNLSPDKMSLIRGRMQLRRTGEIRRVEENTSKTPEKERVNESATLALPRSHEKTAQELADKTGVSRRTIFNDAKFAKAVETVKTVAPTIEKQVGKSGGPTRKTIIAAAKVAEKEPEKAKAILAAKAPDVSEPPSPVDPAKPWADFEKQIDGITSQLKSVRIQLAKILEYDADTKQIRAKWAHFYSYMSTIHAINLLIRFLEHAVPCQLSDKPPGYISIDLANVRRRQQV